MLRLIAYLIAIALAATGLSWLADRPGSLVINWQGYEIETSVFRAIVIFALVLALSILVWSAISYVWSSPASLGRFLNRRRQERGLEALSSGMMAVGAGDRGSATRYALQARKTLPNEPLTHLLRAQVAQLTGDRITARRIFEAMLASPETEQLGLRGLFLEAEREGEREAARQFAERAVRLNPKLGWPLDALFDIQCKESDWTGALETLVIARRHNHIEKSTGDRRRAVLLTARAQELEELDPERALQLALEAHGLAVDLVPAAAIAGRLLAAKGNTPRATRILQRTWRKAQHPDIATAYAYARLGDSPRDRLDRIRQLANLAPHTVESPIAVATAAIEAKDWDVARRALETLSEHRLTQRVCTLMARVEGEQNGDKGRMREWLARAVHAPRDPVWTADGVVSDRWLPTSPVTGALDAFQYRVPVEESQDGAMLAARKLDELMKITAAREQAEAPAKRDVIDVQPRQPEPPKARPEPMAAPAPAAAQATAPRAPVQPPAPAPTKAAPTTVTTPAVDAASLYRQIRQTAAERTVMVAPAMNGAQPPAPAPVPAAAAVAGPARPAQQAATAPRMWLPPKPPDDPGPDVGDAEEALRPATSDILGAPAKGTA